MGKSCCAIDCTNRFCKKSEMSFYRLPKAKEKRSKWIAAIRRNNWTPGTETWICARHFVSGKKSDDPLHPDYVPSLFSFTSATDRSRAVNNLERHLRCREVFEKRLSNSSRELAATALLNLHQTPASEAEIKTEVKIEVKTEDLTEVPWTEGLTDVVPRTEVQTDEIRGTEGRTVEVRGIGVQTEETHRDIASLHKQIKSLNTECQSLRDKVCDLESELKRHTLDPSDFDDKKMKFFTGLPNLPTFMLLFNFVSSALPATAKKSSLKPTQEICITLMKLRLNLSGELIGYLFGVHQSTVSRIFRRWIQVMASRLHPLILWPEREDLRLSLPMCFRTCFENCISIIDCFDVLIERPSDVNARAQTWSNYKRHNTMKFLISFTPQGSISFVSAAYGGRVSDKDLVENCAFLDKLQPGDVVLADRGFTKEDGVGLFCAELITPPFTGGKKQLSSKEIESAQDISSVRIHVKKLIGMLRQKYTILGSTLPISVIREEQNGRVDFSFIDKIVLTCCALCNMCESVVASD